ncbi:hypothetical protein BDK51DRAFT_29172, partial [Blyttiomyces helicus]
MSSTIPCKYGATCYQRNPKHLAAFSHPQPAPSAPPPPPAAGRRKRLPARQPPPAASPPAKRQKRSAVAEDAEREEEEEVDRGDGTADMDVVPAATDGVLCFGGLRPKRVIPDGDSFEVTSSSSTAKYMLKRTSDHYYCTCPAWRNQGRFPVDARTCKHLRAELGDAYETARLKAVNPNGPAPAPAAKKEGGKPVAGATGKGKLADGDGDGKDVPSLLLAEKWDLEKGPDLSGWWLSEKLDGVRAVWVPGAGGKFGCFFSRLGNPFYAPDWFCELPDNPFEARTDAIRAYFASPTGAKALGTV